MSTGTPWLLHAQRLLRERRLPAAIASFRIAERKGAAPDECSAGRWTANMLLGRLEEAWRESDAIRLRGAPDPHRFWNGEDVRGKRVMVRCLHGLGDAVQYLRYIPALRRNARSVTVEVPPPMLELARMIDGVEEAITWGEDAPRLTPPWDVQVEVTELPYLFRTGMADLPIATNYLRLPGHPLRRARECAGTPCLQVGVVWSAGNWNPSRSIPLDVLEPIFELQEISFWNLQGGENRQEWRKFSGRANVHDNPETCADAGLAALATFIAGLDLVISVDTLAAHLAAAMGCPTWILLQHDADWRWMHGRNDSPWYPSASLFRQPTQGDWEGVVRKVSFALETLRESRMRRQAA